MRDEVSGFRSVQLSFRQPIQKENVCEIEKLRLAHYLHICADSRQGLDANFWGSCLAREGLMKTREYLAIKRRIDDFELAESLTRTKLIQGARAGNVAALAMLQERYSLRLPLVEDALKVRPSKRHAARN